MTRPRHTIRASLGVVVAGGVIAGAHMPFLRHHAALGKWRDYSAGACCLPRQAST